MSDKKENAIKNIFTEEGIRKIAKGKLVLSKPILADGKDVTELNFDFLSLSGREYVNALDEGGASGNVNAFRVSTGQAFSLFAVAAAKATDGIDATDIRERMDVLDAMKAAQIATTFFITSSRVGNARILDA